jgi:hypothetical protein
MLNTLRTSPVLPADLAPGMVIHHLSPSSPRRTMRHTVVNVHPAPKGMVRIVTNDIVLTTHATRTLPVEV